MEPLPPDLTIILTTSPIKDHPSTELLEKVFSSFLRVDGLNACRILLVCDGFKTATAYRPKMGKVPEGTAEAYGEYKRRLAALCASDLPIWRNTTLVCLPSHHGFGLAVQHCIALVETTYVSNYSHPPTAAG